MEPIDIHGMWWRAGNGRRKVVGRLTANDDDFALRLFEPLAQPTRLAPGAELWRWDAESVIHGRDLDNDQEYTILDSQVLRSAFGGSETYRPTGLVQGGHLQRGRGLQVKHARIEFGMLRDWLFREARAVEGKVSTANAAADTVAITGQNREIATATVDGATARLMDAVKYDVAARRAHLEHDVILTIDLPPSVEWRRLFEDWVRPFQDLLSLGLGAPSTAKSVFIQPQLAPRGRPARELFAVFIRTVQSSKPATDRNLWPHDMLFCYTDLPSPWADFVPLWFGMYSQLRSPVLWPLLSVDYAPFVWGEDRFLTFSRAAEATHAALLGNDEFGQIELKRRIGLLLGALGGEPASTRAWLKQRMGYANQWTFANRLRALLKIAGSVGTDILAASPRFVRRVVDTRNALTHRLDETHVLGGEARHWHAEALRWLIRAAVMIELGFSQDAVSGLFQRNREFGGCIERLRITA